MAEEKAPAASGSKPAMPEAPAAPARQAAPAATDASPGPARAANASEATGWLGDDGVSYLPPVVPALPTVAAPEKDEEIPEGHVRLATRWPVGDLTVPPLDAGGDTVIITREGTVVDAETAARARQAAHAAGHPLREF
jgi:hypothetical protein